MAEKSSAAEGSSIFESLFGGFSNSLSIFSNNPFRRKNEAALSTEDDASGENDGDDASGKNDGESGSKMEANEGEEDAQGFGTEKMKMSTVKAVLLENAGDSLEQEEGDHQPTATVPEENPESSAKKNNKRADEEVVMSEKKRRKTESVTDVAVDENIKSGFSDSRKRNAEEEAGLDDGTCTESKKKMKKKNASAGLDSSQPQQVLRQSTRNMRKRLNEDLLFSQGIGHKERKLEKTSAKTEELELKGEKDSIEESDLKHTAKRPQGPDGEDKDRKKTELLDDIDLEIPALNRGAEDRVAGAPVLAPPRDTRLGSKRKKDTNVEELYERKRRETVDGKENAKQQLVNTEPQVDVAAAATEMTERLRGKRKLGSDDHGEDGAAVNGAMTKKKKKRTEGRIDNEKRLKRTIFVGNLPVNVKPKQLLREFSQFGAVESARLRSVPLVDTKMPRKAAVIKGQLSESRSSLNGYVVFHEEESARAALAHNMTEFNGKHIRVDMATPPRKGDNIGESGIEYDRSRSIFVGNLPFDVEDEDVYSLFQGKTSDLEVEAVRVVRDPQTSIGKGFAFVCFKKKVGATTALDNAEFTRLRNRQLRIIRFGYKRKPTGGNTSAKKTSGNHRSKPRPGAEERISKRSVLSYEGTRASKVDGRPGKARASQQGRSNEKGRASKSGKTGKNIALLKRPAVAARKMASQGNAGTVGPAGGKRKREEKGVLCLPPPPSTSVTGKLWSVVRSVGSYASSSIKDLLQDSESISNTVGGSMRKLLFNIEKRPETSTGATALRELSLVPITRQTRGRQ